jgi:transposase InsO family protein
VLESDHQPLKWILTNTKLTGKLARWALMLSEFDFEVVHKPGIDNEMDCLSRFLEASSHDSTGVRQEGELEGGCVWSAAACLAWAPLLTGTRWQVPVTERGQMSRLGQRATGGEQLGAAALPQQGGAEGQARSAGEQPGNLRSRGGSPAVCTSGVVLRRAVSGPQGGAEQTVTWGTVGPGVAVQGAGDVWEDVALLALLQGRGYPVGCGRAERDRLQHRARQFQWQGGHLVRQLHDGTTRVIPRQWERDPLIRDVHERAGHFGLRKTLSLLRPHYWWVGLSADVARAVKQCEACDRVKASFNAKHPTLQPLPIKGMFYRWGLDFAGPLPKSRQGNQYVLVMVEHFSKQVILVATRDKEPATVAAAFTREVLTRFGACAEVVTDRGGEFGGEFRSCLDAAFVDHRATSAYHPQANGLRERVVGVVKRSLRKWCLGHASEEWDVYLP